jgi:hypothetical protein
MYLSIIHERPFINSNKNIYKICWVEYNIYEFINKIPENSNILFYQYLEYNIIDNFDNNINILNKIINIYKSIFVEKIEYGENYFEGNVNLMIEIINDILYNTIYNNYKGIRQDDDYWWKL